VFYEWHREHGKKNPILIKLADQELFGFAAVWDRSFKPDDEAIESCALITLHPEHRRAGRHIPPRRSSCHIARSSCNIPAGRV
jgi:putative SOS response-associated peptidase YedK